jgi:WD40 repeat protein
MQATGPAAPVPSKVTGASRDEANWSGTLAADKARLSLEVQHLRAENGELKLQSHELGLLLDAALAKLESLGHSLVPSFTAADLINRLRAARDEEAAQGSVWGAGTAGGELAAGAASDGRGVGQGPLKTAGAVGVGGATAAAGGTSGAAATAVTAAARYRQAASIVPHRGAVLTGEFCPSAQHGSLLATGSFDASVAVLNANTATTDLRVADHGGAVTDVSWATTGATLVTCSLDGTAAVRDVESGLKPTFVYRASATDHPLPASAAGMDVGSVGFQRCHVLPDRSHLFCLLDSYGGVSLIDDRTGRGRVAHISALDPFTAVCADGGINGFGLATGDCHGVVALWDLRQWHSAAGIAGSSSITSTATGPGTTAVVAAAASSASSTPASQANQRRYDMTRSGTLRAGRAGAPVSHIAWSHDTSDRGVIITVSDDGAARVFREDVSRRGGAQQNKRSGTAGPPSQHGTPAAAVSSSGATVIPPVAAVARGGGGGGGAGGNSPKVSTKDPATPSEAPHTTSNTFKSPTSRGPSGGYGGLLGAHNERVFTFDSKAAVHSRAYPIRAAYRTGTRDVSRHHLLNARLQDDDDADAPRTMRRVLGDDDLLVCGGTDGLVRVFQREAITRRRPGRRREGAPERDNMASEDDHSDASDGADNVDDGVNPLRGRLVPLQTLEGHRDTVYGASFHRSEPLLASFSADATVRIWRASRSK